MPAETSRPLIYPVILSGGSGTRGYGRCRARAYPKQLLPLLSDLSLLQDSVKRTADPARFEQQPLILANDEHRFIIAEQLRQIEIKPQTSIMLEPVARNTAPAPAAPRPG